MSNWRDDDRNGLDSADSYYPNDRNSSRRDDDRDWRSRREEDEWYGSERDEGDWKRRRTNQDEYESVPRRHNEEGYDNYYNNDDQYYQEEGNNAYNGERDSYAQGNRSRPRQKPSEPSQHVIFLGLDPDFTESDLTAFVTSSGYNVVNSTIIRDRQTGMSKSFGFVHFSTLAEAQNFVDFSFPFVQLPPPSFISAASGSNEDRSCRVKVDFSQTAHQDGPGGSRGSRSRYGHGSHDMNDGTRDIGSAHVPVILLRGLDVSSTPETIAEAMRSSGGPGKQSAKGMRRVLLVRDQISKISSGIAFVEFVDVQSSSIVLANTMSPTLFPNGFRISGIPVAASFAHPNSFQLTPDNYRRDDCCIDASLALGGRGSGFAKYWEEGTVVSEVVFEVETDDKKYHSKKSREKEREREKEKEKDRKKERSKEGTSKETRQSGSTSLPTATALKQNAAPVSMSLKFFKTGDALAKAASTAISANKLTLAISFDEEPSNDEDDSAQAANEDRSANYARVAPMVGSKKVANNIMKWNTVQGALKGQVAPEEAPTEVVTDKQTTPPASETTQTTPIPVPDDFEYGDLKKMACLLCSRQLKTVELLRRHNMESDLHKKNLANDTLREAAKAKAAAAKKAAESTPAEDAPKYRDRALERRVIYGQPDIPPPPGADGNGASKRKYAEGPAPPPRAPTPPPAPINPGEDANNKGNMLLKKMGWSTGTGLGLSGEGRVDPITTAIYAQGVGLGASKGKEIGTGTDPFDYSSSVKASARERYQSS